MRRLLAAMLIVISYESAASEGEDRAALIERCEEIHAEGIALDEEFAAADVILMSFVHWRESDQRACTYLEPAKERIYVVVFTDSEMYIRSTIVYATKMVETPEG